MVEKQVFIPLADLNIVELRCPTDECSFRVTAELSKVPEVDFPTKCPCAVNGWLERGFSYYWMHGRNSCPSQRARRFISASRQQTRHHSAPIDTFGGAATHCRVEPPFRPTGVTL